MSVIHNNDYLGSFINYEISSPSENLSEFKLERMKHFLKLIGNPQDRFKAVHVAGSKGKGSTCAVIASILERSGYRVGLYTSPHLDDQRERIRILNNDLRGDSNDLFPDCITEQRLQETIEFIKPFAEQMRDHPEFGRLTFFELFTALAFYYFAQEKVDIAVLETGLGGRLDATNVCDSLVCVLTPISLEHTQWLGETLTEIAAEKAAIIRDPKQRVVIAPQESGVRSVFENRCREFNIDPVNVENFVFEGAGQKADKQTFHLKTAKNHYKSLSTRLLGKHQMINIATAIGAVEALQDLGFNISGSAIFNGIDMVFWPGRFEIIAQDPFIVLDGAHNQSSAQNLVRTIREMFPGRNVILVLGSSNDKDKGGILNELSLVADKVIATQADHPRAYSFSFAELKRSFPKKVIFQTLNVKDALGLAKKLSGPSDVVLVTGSLFLVGEMRRLCRK